MTMAVINSLSACRGWELVRQDSICASRSSRKVLPGKPNALRVALWETAELAGAISVVSCFSGSLEIVSLSSGMWLNVLKLPSWVPAEGLSLLSKPASSLHSKPLKQDEWPGYFGTSPKLLPLPGWCVRRLLCWDNDRNNCGLMGVDCGPATVLSIWLRLLLEASQQF